MRKMTEANETIKYLDKLCYHKTAHMWGIAVVGNRGRMLGARFIAIQILGDGRFISIGYFDEPVEGFKLLEWLSQYPKIAKKLAEPMEV